MDSKSILEILKEEIVPAEGCTEPIAIAYVCAKAAEILDDEIEKIKIEVSGNMIKNVKSVLIPNSNGLIGIEAACAMGAVVGDASKELLVISEVDSKDLAKVNKFLKKDVIEVLHNKSTPPLYA